MERIRTDDLSIPTRPVVGGSPSVSTRPSEPTPVEACPGCGGAGYYLLRVPYGHPDWSRPRRCECQDGTPLPGQVAMLARLRGELGQLADCTFETFNTEWQFAAFTWEYDGRTREPEDQQDDLQHAYLCALDYSAHLDGWLYLFGSYGAGKSHLAAAVANKAAARGVKTAAASVPKLLDFIRSGYRDGSASERIDALQNVPLLILDDLGAEAAKRDTDELLFQLLNHRSRERANLPTIITSNVHPDDLEPRIADRVYGQTAGGERIVWMPISSYRRIR